LPAIPAKLDVKRDKHVEILWQDGRRSVYDLGYLRAMCPCAVCKEVRHPPDKKKTSLTILPGNYAAPLTILKAELVGNYALQIDWSDDHSSGIYTFEYLQAIDPKLKNPPSATEDAREG